MPFTMKKNDYLDSETFKTGLNLESYLTTENGNNEADSSRRKHSNDYNGVNSIDNIMDTSQLSRLPHTVNMLTLKEMLLSDAPFISRVNRNFWRKWLDMKSYHDIMAAHYRIIAGSFGENGALFVDSFYDLSSHPLFNDFIAKNLVSLFILENVKTFERDRFFAKFPEILCYMTMNALAASIPKHHRVYNSIKFREVLLDFTIELICGMKPINIFFNREWLFHDAMDTSIFIVSRRPNILSSSTSASSSSSAVVADNVMHQESSNKSNQPRYKNIRSWYTIEHSPLISTFLGLNKNNLHSINMNNHTQSHDQRIDSNTPNQLALLAARVAGILKEGDNIQDNDPNSNNDNDKESDLSDEEDAMSVTMMGTRRSSKATNTKLNGIHAISKSSRSTPRTGRTNNSGKYTLRDISRHESKDIRSASVIERLKALGSPAIDRQVSLSFSDDPSNVNTPHSIPLSASASASFHLQRLTSHSNHQEPNQLNHENSDIFGQLNINNMNSNDMWSPSSSTSRTSNISRPASFLQPQSSSRVQTSNRDYCTLIPLSASHTPVTGRFSMSPLFQSQQLNFIDSNSHINSNNNNNNNQNMNNTGFTPLGTNRTRRSQMPNIDNRSTPNTNRSSDDQSRSNQKSFQSNLLDSSQHNMNKSTNSIDLNHPKKDYIDENIKSIKRRNHLAVKLELTHPPDRSLVFMSSSSSMNNIHNSSNSYNHHDVGNDNFNNNNELNRIMKNRKKYLKEMISSDEIRDHLRQSMRRRHSLIDTIEQKNENLHHDMINMKKNYRLYMNQLEIMKQSLSTSDIIENAIQELNGKGRISLQTLNPAMLMPIPQANIPQLSTGKSSKATSVGTKQSVTTTRSKTISVASTSSKGRGSINQGRGNIGIILS